MDKGKLFIVGTPIGNLEDITLRALRVLKDVDIILCEDTKTSIKLLNHYQIKKTLYSYYKPKEKEKLEQVIKWLKEGRKIALISDAGMPLISDPGEMLVKRVREENIKIECVPGPSSILTALSLSGFSSGRFIFEGFLPKQDSLKKRRLEEIKNLPHTSIFFVPSREILKTVFVIKEVFGNRRICIARELTKLFEEVTITDIDVFLREKKGLKGEITLLVEGAKEDLNCFDINEIKAIIEKEQKRGKTFKDFLRDGKIKKVNKNLLYDLWEEIKNGKRKD